MICQLYTATTNLLFVHTATIMVHVITKTVTPPRTAPIIIAKTNVCKMSSSLIKKVKSNYYGYATEVILSYYKL